MKRTILAIVLAASLLFSGCSVIDTVQSGAAEESKAGSETSAEVNTEGTKEESSETTESTEAEVVDLNLNIDDLFSNRDREGTYDESDAAFITLNGSSASCDSNAVEIDGSTVTITGEGVYILSGTLDDGMIIVNATKDEKVQLVLNGASIHSETSAAIYVLQADKVFLTLAENTENALSNGGTFEAIDENDIDAVVFSKDDLTMNGTGSLTVTSPAGHGVVSKDELTITGGVYTVDSASHGLSGKDSVCTTDAVMNITSGKDGIHSENNDDTSLGFVYVESGEYTIAAEGDGISAAAFMQIDGGVFDIVSGGGSVNAEKQTSDSWGMGGGMMQPGGGKGGRTMTITTVSTTDTTTTEDSTSIKGVKCSGNMVINDGTFTIDSADDALHSNGALTVNDGAFTIKTGDDGFHADAAMTVNMGTIDISECYEGLEGISVAVNGGEISIVADDDGLNAAGGTDASGFGGMRGGDMFASNPDSFINITGGTLYIEASGDGVDSNGSLEISGGDVTISGPTVGDTAAIDYASTGTITGGKLIATGSSMMAQSVTGSGQGVIALSVGNQTAGTAVSVADADGNVLLSTEPAMDFAVVVLSCPEMTKGETYTVTVGSSSGEFEAQ